MVKKLKSYLQKDLNWDAWKMKGQNIEPVQSFKYLVMVFHSSAKRSAHQNYYHSKCSKQNQWQQFNLFICPEEHSIFQQNWLHSAKACEQLLFVVQLGFYSSLTPLKRMQSKFLKAMFQVAHCVSDGILRRKIIYLKSKQVPGLNCSIFVKNYRFEFVPYRGQLWISMVQDHFTKTSISPLSREGLLMMGYECSLSAFK